MALFGYLFGTLATHLLEAVEQELVNNSPELTDIVVKEIELLITKLENLIKIKKQNSIFASGSLPAK